MAKAELKPLFVRMSDVQEVFGLHRSTVNRMANRGEIKIHKLGSSAFVRVSDMEELITSGNRSQTNGAGE